MNFPTIPAGYVWAVTLNDAATKQIFEIVYVSSTSGGVLQGCQRGQEGTTARAWNTNDFAFAADTAGILRSLATTAQLTGYAQLNPSVPQAGSLSVTGTIQASNGLVSSNGATIGGPLIGATTGAFSGTVNANTYIANQGYASVAMIWNSNPAYGNGTAAIAANSGVSAGGILGDAFFISVGGIGYTLTVDHSLNVGVGGGLVAQSNIISVSGFVQAPTITQNGSQVVSTLSSSTLSVSKSGSNYDIELVSSMPVGGAISQGGNGGTPTITLPNYGQWAIEVLYGLFQVGVANLNIRLALTGGTITSGFLTHANGNSSNSTESYLLIYGQGQTSVNNQTLVFTLTISGGSVDPSNQPWTVRAFRIA